MMRPLFASALLLSTTLWAGAPIHPAPPAPRAAPRPAPTPELGQPTLITLHYKDAPPAAIFKDLGDQIGREFITSNDDMSRWPAVSLDADKQPYWQVIAQLNDALGCATNLRANGNIYVSRGARRDGIRYISGPCMFLLNMVRREANFTTPDYVDICILNVSLYFEPNLAVATFSGRVRPDLAVDERGNSLVPPPELLAPTNPPFGSRANPIGFGTGIPGVDAAVKTFRADFASTFQIALTPPANAGYRIARVKGNVHLNIIEKSTDIEIPASEFTQTHTADFHGARITISPILSPAPAGGPASLPSYRVSLNIQRGGLSDDEWGKVNDLFDAVDLSVLDDKGVAFTNSGGGGGGGRASTNRMISAYYQQNQGLGTPDNVAGPPVKCRITIPDATRDIPIPFEFQDLPLP